jgi:hypothetical protein
LVPVFKTSKIKELSVGFGFFWEKISDPKKPPIYRRLFDLLLLLF